MIPFVAVAVVATALAVFGRTKGPDWIHFLAKPAILPPLLAAVYWLPSLLPPSARVALAVALTLAWIGDIALMFGRGFLIGLVSFLFAHVAYLACFSLESPLAWSQVVWLLAVVPFAYLGLRGVLAYVGRLKIPVLIYATALALVAWRLLVRFDRVEEIGAPSWILGVVGGGLFILGDSLLVRRRFAKARIPYWLELGSYAASQVCIVAATVRMG
jgi:uncharacterized membrane protein YhhN